MISPKPNRTSKYINIFGHPSVSNAIKVINIKYITYMIYTA